VLYSRLDARRGENTSLNNRASCP